MVQIHSPDHLSGLKFNTFMLLFFMQLLSVLVVKLVNSK